MNKQKYKTLNLLSAFALFALAAPYSYSAAPSNDLATPNATAQTVAEPAAVGTKKFNIVFYMAGGFQAAINSDATHPTKGVLLEAGVFTVIDMPKSFPSIELGANAKYNTGLDVGTQNKDDKSKIDVDKSKAG